jgi:hypothetical protein
MVLFEYRLAGAASNQARHLLGSDGVFRPPAAAKAGAGSCAMSLKTGYGPGKV